MNNNESDVDSTPISIRVQCTICPRIETHLIARDAINSGYFRLKGIAPTEVIYSSIQGLCNKCLLSEAKAHEIPRRTRQELQAHASQLAKGYQENENVSSEDDYKLYRELGHAWETVARLCTQYYDEALIEVLMVLRDFAKDYYPDAHNVFNTALHSLR